MGVSLSDKRDQADYNDLTRWGVVALVSSAVAIMSVNLIGLIPESTLSGLHASRLHGGSFNQMRSQVIELRQESARLARDNRALVNRLDIIDDNRGEVTRRVSALEHSIPLLVEVIPFGTDVDRSLLTASFTRAGLEIQEVDGGAMALRQMPLFPAAAPEATEMVSLEQPMPPVITERPSTDSETHQVHQGIAIGPVISHSQAPDEWNTILTRVGSLLVGTAPLLIDSGRESETRLIAGPLPDKASAEALCARIIRQDMQCDLMAYEGLSFL
ncbi:hypothetical protein GCM10011499_23970 [Pelagibacterium lentulum]|uniref:SPOR domain-containing protein n=1 Tax=Pelagibacterium lentulum TaxID=2029865 RepID=A0A916RED5_9HYPH|nr:hypothetical protein GCM10011499_23970 [Pelagibacterium lentulum]